VRKLTATPSSFQAATPSEKVGRQDESQRPEWSTQQLRRRAPGRLPRAITSGALNLHKILLPLEVQIWQLPQAALGVGSGVLNRTGEDPDVVAEVDP
jgi:hypothetical protein